jgi:uncharacterized protein (TIGR02453 family)
MPKSDTKQFRGLPADFFAFFKELADNNERAWFQANKARYEESVVRPMTLLVADMAPRLARISKHYIADPKRSLFRIYRDVRFSKDKSPYKTHAAAQFCHAAGRDVHAPGFYVHASPGDIFIGGGMWMPPAPQLKAVRDAIARRTADWARATRDPKFVKTFDGLSDDADYTLKRPPKGYDPAHPAITDLKRTSFVFGIAATDAQAKNAGFIDRIEAAFVASKPPMRFLCKALGLEF